MYELTTNVVPEEGGTVSPPSGTFKDGENVEVEAVSADGWKFTEWTGTINSSENPLTFIINENTDLTAHFETLADAVTTYDLTVKVSPKEGGSVEPSNGIFEAGEEVKLKVTPAEGWQFVEWPGTMKSTDNPLVFKISEDINLAAHFEEKAKAYSEVITITDGMNSFDLTWGMQTEATEGFDSELEKQAPPAPPEGSFFAHFAIPDYNLFTDYRPLSTEKTIWKLKFAAEKGGSITLEWKINADNSAGSLTLSDNFKNPSIEIDMTKISSYQPDSSVNTLYIVQE